MNIKTIAPLGIAAVLGLAAAMVARNMLANRPVQVNAGDSALRTVVVANTTIGPGVQIDPSMLITAKVSQEMAPEDAFGSTTELEGRVANGPIYKGQPIIGTLLAPKGSVGGMQALVPKGMRAITLQVDEFTGVGGFVAPGCRVDLLATMQGERQGDMVTRTVVQNILVTAVGQRMTLQAQNGQQEAPTRSVTLIASLEEAQSIELAASTGRPRLVLRNLNDDSNTAPAVTSLMDFKAGEKASTPVGDPFAMHTPTAVETAPAFPVSTPVQSPVDDGFKSEPNATWTVKVIRGGTESEVSFSLPNKPTGKSSPQPRKHEPITQTENKSLGN